MGDDPSPQRHQVMEVPPVMARVTEYRLHALHCRHCGKRTRAAWPVGVPRGSFGARLQALIITCTGAYHLSKRNTQQLVRDFFGAEISLGSVSNVEQLASAAMAPMFDEARKAVERASIVNADETSWPERSRTAWLWVADTPKVSLYLIRDRRNRKVARELLRHFKGTLGSDGYNVYDYISPRRRQLCWAHLMRHFRGLIDLGGTAATHGEALLGIAKRLFAAWHVEPEYGSRRASFRETGEALRREFAAALRAGLASGDPDAKRECKTLLRHEQSLWTFLYRDGVELTNNAAERALRGAVLWRKRSFGTDSPAGSRYVERIMTVVGTLRRFGRNVLQFLIRVCAAAPSCLPPPRLVSGT